MRAGFACLGDSPSSVMTVTSTRSSSPSLNGGRVRDHAPRAARLHGGPAALAAPLLHTVTRRLPA